MSKLINTVLIVVLASVTYGQDFDIAKFAAELERLGKLQQESNVNVGTNVSARCVSSSGLSIYDIELNLASSTGEFRYRFMGQDIFYSVTIEEVTNEIARGVAVFQSSRSGETRGNPFSFMYNFAQRTFAEGTVTYSCSES